MSEIVRQVLLSVPLALPIVGGVLMALSLREVTGRGWLQSETNTEMKFRRPRLARAGVALVGLFFPCAIVTLGLVEGFSTPFKADWNSFLLILELLAVFGLPALLILSFCGPSDLDLNCARRTYRWRSGMPWRIRVRSGTWDDLSTVYIQVIGDTEDEYRAGVKWKGKQSLEACVLGTFKGRAKAERFADEIAEKLHLPRVELAPQLTRRRWVRSLKLPKLRSFR